MNTNRLILPWLCLLPGMLLWTGLILKVSAQDRKVETQTNVMTEVEAKASRKYADPFHDVTLDVVFTDPSGKEAKVPASWAGGNVWKVRYASPVAGTHRFHSTYADAGDAALHD